MMLLIVSALVAVRAGNQWIYPQQYAALMKIYNELGELISAPLTWCRLLTPPTQVAVARIALDLSTLGTVNRAYAETP
jgi:hypothetical protein